MPPKPGASTNALRAEKPAALQLLGPLVEQRIDGRGERGALDRNLAVGLDEHEQDVLAAQPRQQLVARSVAEGVVADLLCEDGGIVDVGLHRADLVDDEAGGARGGDGGVGEQLRARHRTQQPDGARAPRRRAATIGDCRPPTRISRNSARVVTTTRTTASVTPPTMSRFAFVRPSAERIVSTPVPRLPKSPTGSNGRATNVTNAMSRIFKMTTRPRIGPTSPARMRRGDGGQDDGQRDEREPLERDPEERGQRDVTAAGPERRERPRRAEAARTVSTAAILVRSRSSAPCRAGRRDAGSGCVRVAAVAPSHHTSRPNDSASRARATTRAAWTTASGSTSAAATVSTIPCVAATTLRQ